MVIIQNFLRSMEVLFSIEYRIPPLIIDRVFNWIFTVIWVISVYYFIEDPILHSYPTRTLWCVSFALLPPFSLSSCPTGILCPWKVFISFHVCYTHSPCAKLVPHFWWGDVIHPVTLTNVDAMAPQFTSPYFRHDSWSISTTPLIIVHGIHIFSPQRSLPHCNMKFKGIEKRLGEVMSPVHAGEKTGYLKPYVNIRQQEEYAVQYIAQD